MGQVGQSGWLPHGSDGGANEGLVEGGGYGAGGGGRLLLGGETATIMLVELLMSAKKYERFLSQTKT